MHVPFSFVCGPQSLSSSVIIVLLGLVQTSNFSYAEPNANELNSQMT